MGGGTLASIFVKGSEFVSLIGYATLMLRVQAYPEQISRVREMYATALGQVPGLEVMEDGDIATETERFRLALREYDLAMKACHDRCDALLSQLREDLTMVDKFTEPKDYCFGRRSLGEINLGESYSEISDIEKSCSEHRKIAERARRAIVMAQEHKSLKRLAMVHREAMSLDLEQR